MLSYSKLLHCGVTLRCCTRRRFGHAVPAADPQHTAEKLSISGEEPSKRNWRDEQRCCTFEQNCCVACFHILPTLGPLALQQGHPSASFLPPRLPHSVTLPSSLPFPFTIFIAFIPLPLHPAVLLPSLGSAPFSHCQMHSTPQIPLPTASHTEQISDRIQNLS